MRGWSDIDGDTIELGGLGSQPGDVPLAIRQAGMGTATVYLTPTMRRELAAALLVGLEGDRLPPIVSPLPAWPSERTMDSICTYNGERIGAVLDCIMQHVRALEVAAGVVKS